MHQNDTPHYSQDSLISVNENSDNQDALIFDGSHLIVDTDSFNQVTGYSREGSVTLNDVIALVHSPDWQDFLLRQLNEAHSQGTSVNIEFWFSHQSGEIRLASLYGRGRMDILIPGGFKLYLIDKPHPCKDFILEETPISRYSRLFNFENYLFAVSLPDSTLLFVNDAYARFYHTNAENLLGTKWIDLLRQEESRRHLELIQSLNTSCPRFKIESYSYDDKGEKRWHEWSVIASYDKSGILRELSAVGYDVTHYKAINNELAISKARYKAIVEIQSELIVRHLYDGEILFVNEAFCRFFGAQQSDLIGLIWFDLIDKDIYRIIQDKMARMTVLNPTYKLEILHRRFDGAFRWISWNSTGILSSDGELTEFLVVGRDVTNQKEMDDQLLKVNAELTALKSRLEQENRYLIEKVTGKMHIEGIVADSPKMHGVFEKVIQVAETEAPVLLMGETGTGKELIAQAIHNASKRSRRTMITVNCAALPSSLIESELFGREKGAYTGALSKQIGRFELADQSTIFLDEVGELPLDIQVKLLRVIQFGEYQLLGSPETRKVNVRIIAATNRSLSRAVSEGLFRSDLFYRLNVFPIMLPPLRERKEDIPSLVFHFLEEIGQKMGKRFDKVSTQSMNRLLRYDWPGNIRELRNIVEYNMILSPGPQLEIHLHDNQSDIQVSDSLDEQQKTHIEKVLEQSDWRIRGMGGAAEKLGMKESTLRFRMNKLGIKRKGDHS